MISPKLVKLVNIARGWAAKNVPDFDDAQYRLVLRNVGNVREDAAGHVSSKNLDNSTIEHVMAWFESVGWVDRVHGAGYWTRQAAVGGGRQEYSVDGLVRKYKISGPYLAGIIDRITHGRANTVSGCNAYEQGKIIEALKAIGSREAAKSSVSASPRRRVVASPQIPTAEEVAQYSDIPF